MPQMPGDTQATDAQMRDTFIEHLTGQFVTGRDGAAAYFDWWLTQRDAAIIKQAKCEGWEDGKIDTLRGLDIFGDTDAENPYQE